MIHLSQEVMRPVAPDWYPLIDKALAAMDTAYLASIIACDDWLPGKAALFSAFSLPLADTRYILLGESPYPRAASANGYAFWDAAVGELWSATGLTKPVNRATSLRNMIKMLLYARGDLTHDFSPPAIAALDKRNYITTLDELFANFMQAGILLLNATLVYQKNQVKLHARHWRRFMDVLLSEIFHQNHHIELILLGNIAQKLEVDAKRLALLAKHPYNISFITDPDVVKFFQPFDFLMRR